MQVRARPLNALTTMASIVVVLTATGLAQFEFGGVDGSYRPLPNIPYDGRFTFVRVRYSPSLGGYWPGRRPSWIHGYPLAERNLMKIMNEVSFIDAHEEINTVTLDDPELFRYPIAYIIEVGWWTVTEREAAGLRAYLQKGGFLFVDDFKPEGCLASAAAIDFFTVPTPTGRVLFVLIILSHHRRRIVHFNITDHPTATWSAQQVVDAFPDETAPSSSRHPRGKQRPRRAIVLAMDSHGSAWLRHALAARPDLD
jgi:Domain of unknown function (DUF4159)